MKKIIAIAITAVLMLSAGFALDFEVGVHGILGRNLDSGSFEDNLNAAKEDMTFDYGFGAYANFALFGGLGIQAEANYVTSSITFAQEGADSVKYNIDKAEYYSKRVINIPCSTQITEDQIHFVADKLKEILK